MISAKKQRKTKGWERLEISSRRLETPREHFIDGTAKDRNGVDLTEAKGVKKRWQEYTELYKKEPNDPDNHDGVITHLQPDILECKVRWALGCTTRNKLVEVMEFQLSSFKSKKMML